MGSRIDLATVAQRGRRFLATDFVRGVLLISGGTALAQALPVLLTPLLTRLYTPEDMAMLGLYTAFLSFCANATTLGYSMAIVSGRTTKESGILTAIALVLVGPMATVFSFVLTSLIAGGALGYGELPFRAVFAMWLSLIFTGLFFSLRYWLVRSESYALISKATVAQSVGRVGTQVFVGLLGGGWGGLVAGEVVGRAAGLRQLWFASRSALNDIWSTIDRNSLKSVAREYRKFPLLTAPSAMLNSLSLVLPVPLLTAFFGLYEAGQFAVAYRILALPLSLVGVSIADVFHSRISRISREEPQRALSFFVLVAVGLLGIGIGPMVIVGVAGEPIFEWILGSTWGVAGSIAAAIVPWTLMEFVVGPLSRVVLVYRGQELKLVYDVLALVSVVGCILYGSSDNWSLVETCRLLAWSQALVFSVYFGLLIAVVQKYRLINVPAEHAGSGA